MENIGIMLNIFKHIWIYLNKPSLQAGGASRKVYPGINPEFSTRIL